jgi:hypothetical protein
LRGPKPTLRAVGGTQVYAFGGIDGGNVFARSLAPTSSKPPQEPILRGLSDGLLPLVAGTLQIWTVGFTGAIARRYRHEHLVTALRLPRYEHARAFASQAVNVVASLVAFAAVYQCHRSLKRAWLRNHRVRLHLALDIRERVGRRKNYGDGNQQSDSCAVHSMKMLPGRVERNQAKETRNRSIRLSRWRLRARSLVLARLQPPTTLRRKSSSR